jgi:hypothetical protein
MWNIFKDIGSKAPQTVKSCSIGLDIDDVSCYDQAKVANYFNIASSLVKK